MSVSTFYPDGNPETVSVDGRADRNSVSEAWATIRGGAGTAAFDSDTSSQLAIHTHAVTSPNWADFRRFFALFDTSSLPDNATISAATLNFVSMSKINNFTDSVSMVTTTPASNTGLASADFSQQGTVKQATDITVANVVADSATYNTMTLNATGRGNISLTGITKFGLRATNDNDNVEPAWVADNWTQVEIAPAEEVLAGDKRPYLQVTYTTPFVPKILVF